MEQTKLLRAAQLIMKDMLDELDRICRENNIEYWIDSGTFLGAVRHKGFIPWDDDIDVCMLPKDYEKFLKIAETELNKDKYFLDTPLTDEYMEQKWAKIRDRNSMLIEKDQSEIEKFHQGLSIDIFPMIYLKNTSKRKYKFLIKINKKLNKEGKHKLFRNISKNIGLTKILKNMYRNLLTDKIEEAELVGYKYKWSEMFKRKDIFPLKEIEFEGSIYSCPNNSKNYLESLYGKTYMELPPEDKRIWHAKEIRLNEKCFFEKELEKNKSK